MAALDETANRQAIWSSTANAIKRRVGNVRWLTFSFSVLGALLATIASQLPQGQVRLFTAIVSAVLFTVVAFLTARFLTDDKVSAWIRARAASEALKREAFKHAASAEPYLDPNTRDKVLNQQRELIEKNVDDIIGYTVSTTGEGSAPRKVLSRDEYVQGRIEQQRKYYHSNADAAQRTARNLRAVEFSLALAAAILTALVGVAGKTPLGIRFDFVALTAVLTTIASAVLSHIEASRLDTIVVTFRAAARRLGNEIAGLENAAALSPADWSGFVNRCEAIISEENGGWVAKWSKKIGSSPEKLTG
jgi:hypothetical protein